MQTCTWPYIKGVHPWRTYFVLEAEVREDTDAGEHELSHAGDASERVLNNHAYDAAKHSTGDAHHTYIPIATCTAVYTTVNRLPQ